MFIKFAAAAAALMIGAGAIAGEHADLILYNASVWTVDDKRPEAEAVAVRGKKIVKVGSSREVLKLKGEKTKLLDLEGKRVLPGFNDSHTHLGNAAEWFFQVPVTDVNDVQLLAKRVAEVAARVPKGIWITGGDWATSAAMPPTRIARPASSPWCPT